MTVTSLLSDDELEARLAAIKSPSPDVPVDNRYRYFRPLEDAADEWMHWAQHPEGRVYFGLDEFDRAMRGIAPGELCLVVGYTQSGKTVLTTQLILNNPHRRIAMFTPDETRVLVLVKLAALVHDISVEHLEALVSHGDADAEEMVRSTARTHFPNLVVFDQSFTLEQMDLALDEAETHWGAACELAIYDYVDLLQGVEETVGRVTALKGWGAGRGLPLVALHQSSRSRGSDGAKVRIDSGGFGGEQQATMLLGVRRQKNYWATVIEEIELKLRTHSRNADQLMEQLTEAHHQLRMHEHTVTISLVKNKRPPGRVVNDVDFTMDEDTGRIWPMSGPTRVPVAVDIPTPPLHVPDEQLAIDLQVEAF